MNTNSCVVERRKIDWTPFEDRFSSSPRLIPVSGKPSAPPSDPNPMKYRLNDGAGRSVEIERQTLTPKQVRRGRPSGGAYAEPCIFDGKEHDWQSMGIAQGKCSKCELRGNRAALAAIGVVVPATGRTLAMCPFCPRYNVVKASPNQNNCLSSHCKRMSGNRSSRISKAKKKR